MQNNNLQHHILIQQHHENILVIPRSELFAQTSAWYGIKPDIFQTYINIIQQHAAYMPRAHAETNAAYKQIIPYVLFTYDHKLFVMQRKASASEQRLASKFSLGIGGHIRHEDMIGNTIESWAMREFQEEVAYHGQTTSVYLGALNDDSDPVGQVHFGMILLMKGNSDQISIKDEHKSGMLLTLDECTKLHDTMENWSQICLDFILNHKELLD